jgi:hypothetical protein
MEEAVISEQDLTNLDEESLPPTYSSQIPVYTNAYEIDEMGANEIADYKPEPLNLSIEPTPSLSYAADEDLSYRD